MRMLRGLIRPGRRFLSLQPDLFSSLQPFSSNAFDDFLIAEKMSKFDSELFFGKQMGDDIIEIPGIKEARNKTMKMLLDDAHPMEFANLAHDVLNTSHCIFAGATPA